MMTRIDATPSRHSRIAMLPWMVAGVRTQYENLRLVAAPLGVEIASYPIVPYREGGLLERLPALGSTQKGNLRSTAQALPLLGRKYDALWTQALLPLLPFVVACDTGLRKLPAIVYTIDTTPALMDPWTHMYYGRSPASAAKRGLRDLLYRYLLRRCAAVTPWSQWAARSFMRDYGVPEERVHVIPPGVDLTQWTIPARRSVAASHRTRERSFRLLFVGADFERKGGHLLLDVFRNHLRDTCELHLVTKAAIPDEAGVHVYREFGPNEQGLRDLYMTCDALVLPTRADCFSMSSIEAMACGLPVVSCPVGGIPEIVCHEQTGFLIPPNDGRSLLGAIQRLVDDPMHATQMGHAGRRVVEKRFDNNRTSTRLYTLLKHHANQQHPNRPWACSSWG